MAKKLAGKVALVTGGSRGIGAATARALAEDGAAVAISYAASAAKAEAIVHELEGKGVRAAAFKADQADPTQVEGLVKKVVERFGRLDILVNNAGVFVTGLAKAAKIFNVPTILTAVASKTFSGPIFATVQAVYPGQVPIDRTTMNTWEDRRVVEQVEKTGRKKVVMAALWTEVCLATAALSAIDDGYEVYIVVTDASAGVTKEAHDMAIQRMMQAGAVPVTWLQVMIEWQRDWARQDSYEAVINVAKEHGGGYGLGINYAKTMLGEHASEGAAPAR
jgi:NAD(P)-dependent dehydrogenase (short-subunit alcohol dehydrogenase family)